MTAKLLFHTKNIGEKGDHKYYKTKEYRYQFKDIDGLINDFYNDINKIKRGEL